METNSPATGTRSVERRAKEAIGARDVIGQAVTSQRTTSSALDKEMSTTPTICKDHDRISRTTAFLRIKRDKRAREGGQFGHARRRRS